MKIKCPTCGNENYFTGLEDEDTRFCSSCNEPLFKIGKEKSYNAILGSKQIFDSQGLLERIQLSIKKDFKQDYLFKIFKNSIEAANAICYLADNKSIDQNKYGLSNTKWFSILFEFIYFYLHLTDRFAFGHMNEERRGSLMTELEEISITAAVDAVCLKWPEDIKEKIKEECMGNFFISMAEYSKCKKWFTKKGEGAKGTLFWEFGKTIAKLAGQENDIIYIMAAMQIATNSLKDLEIKSFINRIKVV